MAIVLNPGLLAPNPFKTDIFDLSRDKDKNRNFSAAGTSGPANFAAQNNTPTGISLFSNETASSLWASQSYAQSGESYAIDAETSDPFKNTDTKMAKPTSEDKFLEFMNKTPEELMREAVLKELGYTEEELQAMDPKERAKVEAEVKELTERKIEESVRKEITGENSKA